VHLFDILSAKVGDFFSLESGDPVDIKLFCSFEALTT